MEKKDLVLYELQKNIMSLIEYQWRENDHFMVSDLDLGERGYDTYHR
jgi:hypothetical protein